MSRLTLAVIVLGLTPQAEPVVNTVDRLEINNFYDDADRLVFSQLICWDFSRPHETFVVRDWRLVKSADMRPTLNSATGWYAARWVDGETYREVRSRCCSETWTYTDNELRNRDVLAQEKRPKLSRPRKVKR